MDWGFSGLYPRFFELASLKCILMLRHDEKFEPLVTNEFEKLLGLTNQEKRDTTLTLYVQSANLRWSFEERPQNYAEIHKKNFLDALAASEESAKKQKEAGIPEPPGLAEIRRKHGFQ